ncbi:MAG TPA: 2-C-methyl-D-erythritol 2,4-cyclodiphosphate synthase [Candidatus Cloacimonadota bacterium]|nr:2-C-methyl-D-erythritol 2,4-cyclodiphosphate synthase [Candidatus Cloacimonadota bacterium]
MRIGYGYDVHRLADDRNLILGGVNIPFEQGLLGHSDADVLIHAIIDAMLGALARGDIGKLFPDNDRQYKDIDSRLLLRKAVGLIHEDGFSICNLDSTICAQAPKLQSYIMEMRQNIAFDLGCAIEQISVKATTEENLGISGEGKGITATAVILLKRI